MKDAALLNKATRAFFDALKEFTDNTGVDTDSVVNTVDMMVENLITDMPESMK